MPGRGIKERLLHRIERDAVVTLTQTMVRTPSHINHTTHEQEMAKIVESTLLEMGCDVRFQEVEDGRANVIGVLKGEAPGPRLFLNGHMDTVPPGEMTDPYSASIRGGRLCGRGSADMKGAIAAMLVAMGAIAGSSVELRGEVAFAGTVAEETGAAGMQCLMDSDIVEADCCIVGEPTSLHIGVAHKGIEWLRITTTGVAAHASLPEVGTNAIMHMARLIARIEDELKPRLEQRTHELLGTSTVNIGTIHGGERPNIVPERCAITVDRRWLPGESIESIHKEFTEIVTSARDLFPDLDVSIERLPEIANVWHGPFESAGHSAILEVAANAVKQWSHKPEIIGLPYWTDGALVQRRGIPTLILGPGDPDQCHTIDESIRVDRLVAAARIYGQIILDLCGPKGDSP